jgi:hypothetical protein
LADAPDQLRKAETKRDTARATYEVQLAVLSLTALGAAYFDGKAAGEKRPAANDAERKLAVEHAVATDEEAQKLLAGFEAAQRDVTYWREWNTNCQLIARLLLSQAK